MRLTPAAPSNRLDHLDAIRGLAALAVVCCHYNSAYGLPYNPRLLTSTPLRAWWDGAAAVSLFFVLSGLVLSIRHFRETTQPRLAGFDYLGFLVGRVCRIGLPYWAVLVASAALWHWSGIHAAGGPPVTKWSADLWQHRPTVGGVVHQANLSNLDAGYELVPQAWTLAIEVVLSALVPAAVLVAAGGTAWLLGATLVACLFGGLNAYALHFAVGVAIAKHYRPLMAWLEPRAAARAGLAAVGWVAYTWADLFMNHHGLHGGNADKLVPGLGAAAVLVACSATLSLRAWLSRGVAHHVGRTSYSLYLSHFLVLLCVTPRLMAFALAHHRWPWVATWAAGLAATIGLALVLAELVYRVAEVPSIALGRRATAAVSTITTPRPRPAPVDQPTPYRRAA